MLESREDRFRAFLKDRPSIALTTLEIECEIPVTTLHKVKSGARKIPEEHWPNLEKVLEKYGWKASKE